MATETDSEIPPPDHPPQAASAAADGWTPKLNPTQQKAYDSTANYILMCGEKGSGKSTGGIHALIRHCHDEMNALVLVVAPAIRSGKEGVFYELERALDLWRNGNIDPKGNRRAGFR